MGTEPPAEASPEPPAEASDDQPNGHPEADSTAEESAHTATDPGQADDTEGPPRPDQASTATTTGPHQPAIPVERLTRSYRFDEELAAILTRLQYRADGITLTAAGDRPVPRVAAPTDGVQAVFDANASLVFVCYDDRGHRTVNPVETALIETIARTVASHQSNGHAHAHPRPNGGPREPLAEGPSDRQSPAADTAEDGPVHGAETAATPPDPAPNAQKTPSVGVVTPHNAQRGALSQVLPEAHTANTVEKYQGGERDVMVVSGTVSDPEFARREEQFLLNPRRLLVAISRARLLTVVVCSSALFEVAPEDSDRLDEGPVWARLFAQTVGREATPAWTGTLAAFTHTAPNADGAIPVRVYPSSVGGGDA